MQSPFCPVCHKSSVWLDVVDFNKSCAEDWGIFLELSGIPCYYAYCEHCGFCFCPAIAAWEPAKFKERIYNDDYLIVDPDYEEKRPKYHAGFLMSVFGHQKHRIRHLDYGGGHGLLSGILREAGWQSVSYDPFMDESSFKPDKGSFNLVTAFEVFEHVSDPRALMECCRDFLDSDISSINGDGMILFSTLVSDGLIKLRQRLNWWYASPRNGHISLFSRRSLELLANDYGFVYAHFIQAPGIHCFFSRLPDWAAHVRGS
jgi:hypothetical protein